MRIIIFCGHIISIFLVCDLQFPELSENIRGEEEATFTNTLGESVTVEVSKEGVKATADILEKVGERWISNNKPVL